MESSPQVFLTKEKCMSLATELINVKELLKDLDCRIKDLWRCL